MMRGVPAPERRGAFAFPAYSARERQADAIVHGAGIAAGLAGIAWLLATRATGLPPAELAGLAAYAGSLCAMLMASAAYNLAGPGPRKETLRRFDHAAIYALIAGTYTPFAAAGPAGGAPLWAVWAAALAGAVAKLAFPRRFERLSLALWLGMGWSILVLSWPLWASLPGGVVWLLGIGGGLYTLGSGVHLLESVAYHNAIWHALVLAAAACHFAAVAMLHGT